MATATRWPAEWEPQRGTLLAWPARHTDWQPQWPQIARDYVGIIRTICAYQDVFLLIPPDQDFNEFISRYRLHSQRLQLIHCDYNDTWCRDYGPINVQQGQQLSALDFAFHGWGGKYAAGLDNQVNSKLREHPRFLQFKMQSVALELEGGAVDTDGRGTVLLSRRWAQSRHPETTLAWLASQLQQQLGAHRCIWLDHGELAGDDTDAHIDTLARFIRTDTIAFQSCDDPSDPHYPGLQLLQRQLEGCRRPNGAHYKLCPLPLPRAIHGQDGRRLPAGYANFLFINGAVLVPAFDDPADQEACDRLARYLPDHAIIPLPCHSLIQQNGSLHCISMNIGQ